MHEKKVAVVTGVAPGLGEEVVKRLIEEGYLVAGIARSSRMHETFSAQDNYQHFQCDLANAFQVSDTIFKIESACGPIDVLITNAHQLMIKPFAETSPADLESVWKNTCFSAMTVAHQVVPKMADRGSGTVIFTGATAALRGGAKFSAFASAKFALRGFAQALAREFSKSGVHVVHAVLDGLIWEEQTRERFNPPQDSCLQPEAIAVSYIALINQDKSAWTQELDLRPFSESF